MKDERGVILMKGECPNGHLYECAPLAIYTREQLDELLDTRTLTLPCAFCGTDFSPTEEAILNLRKQFGD